MKADINVIDFAGLHLHAPEIVYDFPAGARRLIQKVDGYKYNVVSGEIIYENGAPTGALPGKLVRGGRIAHRGASDSKFTFARPPLEVRRPIMTPQERRGWKVIASVALTNFIVMGPSIGTIGIFFTPLIKDFGWSREEVSRLATAFLIAMGIANPLVGWLLDRIEARVVMAIGAVAAGIGYVLASRADSLTALFVLFTLIGLGVGASTILPGIIVAANWIDKQRALATGITIAGAGFGGCVLPPLVAHLILVYGWRTDDALYRRTDVRTRASGNSAGNTHASRRRRRGKRRRATCGR